MSWVDIVIIVILALCALIGLKKGFYKSLMSLFGNFLAIVVAFFLTKVVTLAVLEIPAVNGWVFTETSSLYSWVTSWVGNVTEGFLGNLITPLLGPITDIVNTTGAITQTQGVALYLSYLITSAAVMIVLFILIKIVVAIIFKIIGTLINRESPGALSRLLGFVIGAVKGAVYVVIAMLIMNYALAFPVFQSVGDEIEKSTIGAPVFTQVQTISEKVLASSDNTNVIERLIELSGVSAPEPEPEVTE